MRIATLAMIAMATYAHASIVVNSVNIQGSTSASINYWYSFNADPDIYLLGKSPDDKSLVINSASTTSQSISSQGSIVLPPDSTIFLYPTQGAVANASASLDLSNGIKMIAGASAGISNYYSGRDGASASASLEVSIDFQVFNAPAFLSFNGEGYAGIEFVYPIGTTLIDLTDAKVMLDGNVDYTQFDLDGNPTPIPNGLLDNFLLDPGTYRVSYNFTTTLGYARSDIYGGSFGNLSIVPEAHQLLMISFGFIAILLWRQLRTGFHIS